MARLAKLNARIEQTLNQAAEGKFIDEEIRNFYRLLGGGWEVRQSRNPLDLIPEKTKEEMLERTDYWDKTFKKE